ncbi:DHA2 family efflux MFS transporter permease subunit [Microvirga sp. W0021]|uniref:DHA2 family efflux MFS transporter permease subunit n=1 Tax=Hohaiivirga grylli TaxID=3133970 RepID=A0ABV0BGP3_9HYPH
MSAQTTAEASKPTEETVPFRGIVTLCTMLATLMQALDSTIANVALPYMQGTLAATSDQITWVLTSYIVAAAIMTAPVGWMAQRFGRKRLFIICIVGFTGASVLCGLATSLSQMVAYRVLQGLFGAALVPLSQATMLDIYPLEKRGSAMALWGMGVMVGPILGPTLGGYLTDVFDWRYVFFVNVPFGILVTVGIALCMQESDRKSELKFDWIGFAALGMAVGALQLLLDRGEQVNWFESSEIIIEAILSGTGFYLFIVHMLTAKKPFIPPHIFKDANFVAGLFMIFALGMILLASAALLAPYLQTLGGYPVEQAGLLMAPRGMGTMLAMSIAGRLTARFDPRILIAFGISLLIVTLWEMSYWTPDVSRQTMISVTVVQGFGLGFVFTPMSVITFATLDPKARTDGAAMFSLTRNMGSAIGISIMQFLLARNVQIMHSTISEHVTPFNRALQTGAPAAYWGIDTAYGPQLLNNIINRQASIIAYANDFRLMMFIAIPTLLLLFFMKPPQIRTKRSEVKVKSDEQQHTIMD